MSTLGDNVHVTHAYFLCLDGAVLPVRKRVPSLDITKPIKVGSNCFIGYHAIILLGVTIGDDCIVAAGAVVAKDVPSGKNVAGNPTRIIGGIEDYCKNAREYSTALGKYMGNTKKQKYKEYFGMRK